MNAKSEVLSRAGNDYCPEVSSSDVILEMFQLVAAGLPPSMSTEMFQSSIQSIKQLSARLATFFSHGLATNQVGISLVLVRQFSFHRNYPLALATSLSQMARLKSCSTSPAFIDLIMMVLEELGPANNLLTSPLVDMILQWTMPQINKKQEMSQTSMALKLVQTAGGFIWRDSMYSFQFVYHQIRARLLSFSKSDFSQASGDFGVLCYEAKSVLMDILIVMVRLQEREGFYLEPRLVMDMAEKVVGEENNNAKSEKQEEEEKGDYEVVSYYSGLERSAMTLSPVKLLTPKMIEDDVQSTRSNSCLLTDYRSPETNTEEEELEDDEEDVDVVVEDITTIYQDPVDQVLYEQKEKGGEVVGYLVCSDGESRHEMRNWSCIGRDPRCSVILTGREISTLHARIKLSEGRILLETLSQNNSVRINEQLLQYGVRPPALSDGDVIVVGRQTFTWRVNKM